jgi:hypothetical protein
MPIETGDDVRCLQGDGDGDGDSEAGKGRVAVGFLLLKFFFQL